MLSPSELVLNPDDSLYHIALKSSHVADTVVTVGDPDRVQRVSRHFDQIFETRQHREFITHIGRIGQLRLTVISTGIGPDNVDIVLNELDAAANVDPSTRQFLSERRRLCILRIGTTGGLRPEIEPGSVIVTRYAVGLDNLMAFYDLSGAPHRVPSLENALVQHVVWPSRFAPPLAWRGSETLMKLFPFALEGITLTAPGFYAPQGRTLRLKPAFAELMERFGTFSFEGLAITNFEMETSALYGLGGLLGHETLSLSVVLAQRKTGRFLKDVNAAVDSLIIKTLEALTSQHSFSSLSE
ncbi:MAG: nucleoside phosphorylase [Flavobacteriales bacterium]|nr:nucleoside phosphorylase [Flavobacteriales bacterium]MDW8433005.1 nucleoside phosphorylase [Flavobacteriales bacterium]